MITVIASTNRRNGATSFFAHKVLLFLQAQGQDAQLLDLRDLPSSILHPDMYDGPEAQDATLAEIQAKYMHPASKFYFVVPEYNGGMPGILKLFLDACSINDLKKTFHHKKAAILGIAAGRAGNLRGMEHLTGVLNYMNVTVMPNRQPISQISGLLNDKKEIIDPSTLQTIEAHTADFIQF